MTSPQSPSSPAEQPAIEIPRIGRDLVILPARPKRDFRHNLRNLGIAAGCLAGAAAIGWGAGAHLAAPAPALAPAPKVVALQKADVAQLVGQSEAQQRQDMRELAEQVRALKAGLATVQASLEKRPDDVRALKASVEGVRQGLDAAKSDTASAIAQLSGKLDRTDQAAAQKLAQIADRLDRLEKRPDPMPVGSIAPQPPARPAAAPQILGRPPTNLALPTPAQPAPPRPAEAALQPPPKAPLPGWVLRDVYDGIALVEGRGGYREVQVGEAIPGAGKVEAIEKRGRRWVVVTSQGLIAEVN